MKKKDSSYAHSADAEFRKKMAEFYPGVCEFKKRKLSIKFFKIMEYNP